MTFDPIEKAVCECLKGIPDDARAGSWLWERNNWTQEVKSRLCRLAKAQNKSFRVCASGAVLGVIMGSGCTTYVGASKMKYA